MIAFILTSLLILIAGWLALTTGYLLMLTAAAFWGQRGRVPDGPARRRFGILIPAHNEELLLGRLLQSLEQIDYPRENFDVCVVADNCSDRTAEVARQYRARVYERSDPNLRGKGFALRWLLHTLSAAGSTYDAVVILDADSIVSPNLLRRFDAHLAAGSQVVQAYYSVLNPGGAPIAALRYIALAALHYLRPLGRSALGLSCGLKGNGMCFESQVLEDFAWNWFSLAEDVEFHLVLVRAGLRVDFAPEAQVWADMPTTFAQANSQNERWEKGRLLMLRQEIPALFWDALRRGCRRRLDAAIEQCIPPLSIPLALSGACLIAAFAAGQPLATALAAFSLAGLMAYLWASLILTRAPRHVYRALIFAPLYVGWKLWLFARALVGPGSTEWVRTDRAVSAGSPDLEPTDTRALAS